MRARGALHGVPVRARDRPGGAGYAAHPGPGLSDYGRGQDPMRTGNVSVTCIQIVRKFRNQAQILKKK